ncbi:S-layer homology domain-containing protein [Pleurocapsales cyanobacterium LEGE 10410]|nr:S-layer homology domain-containing protein [Pleurocapsales cyanobacterium LEGE 10410]
MLVWNTTDNRKAVADYYQAELLVNDWQIVKPFTIDPQQKIARAIAVKDELRVELTLLPPTTEGESNGKNTRLAVIYHPVDGKIPRSSIMRANDSAELEPESPNSQPAKSQSEANAAKTDELVPEDYLNLSEGDFTDLNEVPEQLRQPLETVSALGILTPYTGDANVELTKFAPNEIITRGEYARWLITANNRYYSDNPGKKIYVATKTSQPAFNDVKPEHPDFAAIQSLAEAGLVPSRLTGDSTDLLFRPDAPLIREDLITWKVPLDMRQALPQASIEAIQESWGFQDTANIDSLAVRALYADFQNGDRSNLRRVFGYTTLFQPKKPVTRAEAAASLWYFGFQGDGITAQEILQAETESESDS